MTPRQKKYDRPADRLAAHRKRQIDHGRCRVELSLSTTAADKLKSLARVDATTPSAIIESLLADVPDPSVD